MSNVHERLVAAREAAGFRSAAEAAEKFSWSYPTYAAHENGQRGLRPEAAKKYSRAFGVTAAHLLYGDKSTADDIQDAVSVPVIGKVAAGLWLETDSYHYEDDTWVPAVRTPEHRAGQQVAYKVEGPSMNKILPDGVYAIGTLFGTGRSPRHRDVVVLRRFRAGLVETTVKRFIVDNGNVLLMPESDDPRYQTPMVLKSDEDDTHVEIHALVVGSYRPL